MFSTSTIFGGDDMSSQGGVWESGEGVYLDGGGQFVVDDFADSTMNNGTASATQAWICPEMVDNTKRVVTSKDQYGVSFPCCLDRTQNSVFCYTHDIGGGWDFTAPAFVVLNTWQRAVFTFDGGNHRSFLDGKLIGSKAAPITGKTSKGSGGSFSWNQTNGRHKGYIGDLEVLKGEVLYTGGYSVPANSLGGL